MFDELQSLVAQFKALATEISDENAFSNCTSKWVDNLDRGIKLCEALPHLESINPGQSAQVSELETIALGLWNLSVALKTKGMVSAVSNAKIRHIAFWMLEFCGQCFENESNLKRLIMMGLKTGRAWLDGNVAEFAEKVLFKSEKCIQRLRKLVIDKNAVNEDSESSVKEKLEIEQDLFTLLCYQAETFVSLSRPEDALEQMLKAKELLPKFPKEASFLSMLCYNTGVELFQQKLFAEATVWLRESYELGKGQQSIGPKNQARTLRLLSYVYLEYKQDENIQNALNAISLANTEHCHPAGVFTKLKIVLLQNAADNVVKRACEELLSIPELTVDLSLNTLQTVNQYNRVEIMTWLIEELLKRFEHSPDIGKLLVTNAEVLLNAGMKKQAKEFVEYCITAHHTGRPLELSIKKRFHVLFWEQAAASYEGKDFEEALQWYNYSLSLYTQSDTGDLNLAKLHRNRANCLIATHQLDMAKEAIEQSVKNDPTCAHAQYICFKLALLENNNVKACESLKKLCELASTDNVIASGDSLGLCGLVALAAQQALETDKTEAACVALEHLSNTSTDIEQVLTSLRCLIRLKLSVADKSTEHRNEAFEIISYIRMGYNKLLKLQDEDNNRNQFVQNEANWLMKIAWNLALQYEDEPLQMKELYTLCSQLLSLNAQDESCQSRQMTCILMSAAACLQVARNTNEEDKRKGVLEECLEHLGACRELYGRIRQHFIGMPESHNRETDILLLLYEFEARIHLKDPGVENVLEKALTTSGPDPKTFETLAAIAIEPPAHNKNVGVRALKVAIRKHLQAKQPDLSKCSKLFHSLIQLCLSGGSAQDISGKQDAWNYYMEIFDLITTTQLGEYPEMEIVWLMTKAWNCGISLYSCNKYTEAEKWCGMSMRLLKYLPTFRNNYQDHMSSVYADILAKVENTAKRPSLEMLDVPV
ncbi:testis-expressed protein 11-like [Ruditapes philippinarum]|uniref:testis-expressed protein 11-like n=1 Tax=Ruditapes philippinarum TaxID=129788 RepID=UPI00295AC915|nr:testis-expressed protein 11-like [Ruditapes philippinarum]